MPITSGSALADGLAHASATATLDGVNLDSAVSRGTATVSVTATGAIFTEAQSDGVAGVYVLPVLNYLASARADGIAHVWVTYSSDPFGDGGDGGGQYDPNAIGPFSMAPPIQIGMDLRGACSLLPPPLELS